MQEFNLLILYNFYISSYSIPSTWNSARVTPLFIAGDPFDANDYRPVSIIGVAAERFEKRIFIQLFQYFTPIPIWI